MDKRSPSPYLPAMETLENNPKAGKTRKRPVGRPRNDGRPQLTRHTVFLAAAALIAKNGYAGTSIRMIANEVGAVPASIFNLFATKEALLNELIGFVSEPSLQFYKSLTRLQLPVGVALYTSIFREVHAVASAQKHFPALFYLPELAKPEFADAQDVRARLVSHYRDLIETGQKQSIFTVDFVDLAAEQVFQMTETSVIADPQRAAPTVGAQARATARYCVRGLLTDTASLDANEAAAARIDLKIEIPDEALAK